MGEGCEIGVGGCVRVGEIECAADGIAGICRGTPGEPQAERCGNQIDDDCDGEIDEGFRVGEGCEIGLGNCTAQGTRICNAARDATLCDAPPGVPEPERCDGADNDCDGEIDEGFDLGSVCSVGVGACVAQAIRVCDPAGEGSICDGVPGEPTEERCDGVDNDCDGQIDERADGDPLLEACYSGPIDTRGVGVCRAGTRACEAGDLGPCLSQVLPSAEQCDGLDNDCDGVVDEEIPGVGAICTVGVGECANRGVIFCNPATGLTRCGAVAGAPSDEICDARDNDCDGQTDEGDVCATDAAPPDAGPVDANPADATPVDAAAPDASIVDAAPPDASPRPLDVRPPDAGAAHDAHTQDAGFGGYPGERSNLITFMRGQNLYEIFGDTLQVSKGGEIWIVDPDRPDSEMAVIADPESSAIQPAWDFEKRRIMFSSNRGRDFDNDPTPWLNLWIIDIVDGTLTRFTETDNAHDTTSGWSPDGSHVAFSSTRLAVDRDAITGHDLWIANADGTGARPLYQGLGQDEEPVFSVDSRTVYFWTAQPVGCLYQVWQVDVEIGQDSARPVQDEHGAVICGGNISLSPDGEVLYYVGNSGPTRHRFCHVRLSTGEVTVNRSVLEPSIGPSGTRYVYIEWVSRRTGGGYLWVANLDGSDARPVTGFGGDFNPRWTH